MMISFKLMAIMTPLILHLDFRKLNHITIKAKRIFYQ